MGTPYLGEVKICAFNFAPKGWAMCNGQLMAINQNQALFALLGTFYGGNGVQTFALPNLQGRAPVHQGSGFVVGQVGGEVNHTVILSELPAHVHGIGAVSHPGTSNAPAANYFAAHRGGYADSPNDQLVAQTVSNVGGSQPHNNLPPILVLNFCVALVGVFPSRN
jgi:microcystin-dependent protein